MSTSRPRLLFISQTLPYPPDAGVKVRTYNVFRLLAETFEVTALCFYREETGLTEEEVDNRVAALSELGRVEAFPIPQERNVLRFVWDHVRSLLKNRTYTVFGYESAHYRQRLTELLGSVPFDIVHGDSLDMSPYFPLVAHLPLVCVHHDVQSVLLRRRAAMQSALWRRRYLQYQARLMKREERMWCPRVALNVTVSDVDRDELRRIAPGGRYAVVPNGVDTAFFQPAEGGGGGEGGVVFVGGAAWFPNQDAMRFFCDQILPLIRERHEGVTFRWVGRTDDEERRRYRDQYDIDVTGYVEDVRPYLRDAGCYVVPIRIGGGTRVKILDAWASGKAIVTTSVGCEGLEAADGVNILVRDDPREFADAVLTVLTDPNLRRRLEREARRTAEEIYSWNVIGRDMTEAYLSLL